MKEITFDQSELHEGNCISCGETTLITDEDKCPDCVFDKMFFDETINPPN